MLEAKEFEKAVQDLNNCKGARGKILLSLKLWLTRVILTNKRGIAVDQMNYSQLKLASFLLRRDCLY